MTSTTSGTAAPSGLELKLTTVLSGIQKVLPSGSSLTINNAPMTQAQLVTAIQGALAPFTAVRNERNVYQQQVKAKADSLPRARELLQQIRAGAVACFGTASPLLAQLGFNPKVKPQQTAGQKALAAAKRAITRKARGTTSKKQKASIKPTGTPVVSLGANGELQIASPTAAPSGDSGGSPSPTSLASPTPTGPTVVVPAKS